MSALFSKTRMSHKYSVVKDMSEEVSRGNLFEVKDQKGHPFALRILPADSDSNGISYQTLRQSQSQIYHHPHVNSPIAIEMSVQCNSMDVLDCEKAEIAIIQEFADGNLFHLMKRDVEFSSFKIVELLYHILDGIRFLHLHGIIHRRIHPSNILLFEHKGRSIAKITDFQHMAIFSDTMTGQKQSEDPCHVPYMAPEILVGHDRYTPAADMWSFGVVCFQLLFGRLPFGNYRVSSRSEHLHRIFESMGTPSVEWRRVYANNENTEYPASKEYTLHEHIKAGRLNEEMKQLTKNLGKKTTMQFVDLIDRCLRLDPGVRIKAMDAMKMSLFKKGKYLKRQRGSVEILPHIPSTHHGEFMKHRSKLIQSLESDVSNQFITFHLAAGSLFLFDRVQHRASKYMYNGSFVDEESMYTVFCGCFLVALKLMADRETIEHHVWESLKSIRCGAHDQNRRAALYFERWVSNTLDFKFFIEKIRCMKPDIKLFQRLSKGSGSWNTLLCN